MAEMSDFNICLFCKGNVEERFVRHIHERDDTMVLIENVPALVCTQCGERFYSPEVVEKIQQTAWLELEPKRTVAAEVHDFAEVA